MLPSCTNHGISNQLDVLSFRPLMVDCGHTGFALAVLMGFRNLDDLETQVALTEIGDSTTQIPAVRVFQCTES
jgi:hypothetical protein